jgi:glycosyltransferase involved in cell wall biosynthesis
VGDSPAQLLGLANALLAGGNDVTVVTPLWKRTWPERMCVGPLAIVRLRGAPRGGLGALRWMYSLSRWLRGAPLDAVLVAGVKREAYTALGALEAAKPPVVLLAGDDDLPWQHSATFGSRVAARCRAARAIVAPSAAVADELRRAGYRAESLEMIPRGVILPPPRTPATRSAARAALAAVNYDLTTTPTTPVALALGRLDAEHRFGDVVRAWRIVAARHSEARLWIVGDGPERERLYRQIGDLDQRFRAFLPGTFDCSRELLQAANMLIVPSPHSTPPLALVEAQAAGLPVIAADSPAACELLVGGESGTVYPAGDFKTLAAAVLQLIDQPALADAWGAAARALAEARPRAADEAARYAAFIQRLLGRGD